MLSDNQLDATLRDVPLPEDFLARLHAGLVPTDDKLDLWLANIAIRPGLVAALKEIPASIVLDERLTSVATPWHLAGKLRQRTSLDQLRQWQASLGHLVQSLALLWLVTISWVGLLAIVLLATYRPLVDQPDILQIGPYSGPLTLTSAFVETPLEASLVISPPETPAGSEGASETGLLATVSNSKTSPLSAENRLNTEQHPFDPGIAAAEPGVDPWTQTIPPIRALPGSLAVSVGPNSASGLLNRLPLVLGSPQRPLEQLPFVEFPQLHLPHGVDPPVVRGYDRNFFLKQRLFPLMSPAASSTLANFAVPLTTETFTYDRWQRAVTVMEKIAAAEIRTEEFIASQNYQFSAAPPGQLALRIAAGPSLFGGPGATLWQVGVQAGSHRTPNSPGRHIILLVDASARLTQNYSLEVFRQAISRVLAQRQPQDQLSVLIGLETVAEEKAQIFQIERRVVANAAEADLLLAELQQVQLVGKSHAEELLKEGLALAKGSRQQNLPLDSQLVLLTADESAWATSPAALPAGEASEGKILFVWGESRLPDRLAKSPLGVWAAAQHGRILACESGGQLCRGLIGGISSKKESDAGILAKQITLTVHFRPAAVAAFRLLGHESSVLSSNSTNIGLATTLFEGESTTSVLEIWPHEGTDDELGTAELRWLDANGQPQTATQRLSRLQITPTWEESAISLQQATLVAETAEVLRGSREKLREIGLNSGSTSDLKGILTAAQRASPQLWKRLDFQQLIKGIQHQAVSRRGSKNRSGAPFKAE